MGKFSIAGADALEILDSRGNPTVKARVVLEGGAAGEAAVPSGASTGIHEARELRDGELSRFGGKGVRRAAEHVRTVLAEAVKGLDAREQGAVDEALEAADGTEALERLGANAVLAVSMAAARAAAAQASLPLYRFLGGPEARQLPVPLMNIVNGGAHAANNLDIQEFMILPHGAPSFGEGLRWCCEIYHTLGRTLRERGLAVGVGDEGGYAPDLDSDRQALERILEAVEAAGYVPGKQVSLALDAAVSQWYLGEGRYRTPKGGREYTFRQLADWWEELAGAYPLLSLEDGMGEDDWEGWRYLTKRLGSRLQLVGDDLFVTSPVRLQRGMEEAAANAVLIKPNQIGTLSRARQAVELAQNTGWNAVLSHRSGETEDATLADLAVAWSCGQLKAGAPCRGERTAKYNRLLEIQRQLGEQAAYTRIRNG